MQDADSGAGCAEGGGCEPFDFHADAVWNLVCQLTPSTDAAQEVLVATFRSAARRAGRPRLVGGSARVGLLAIAVRLSRPVVTPTVQAELIMRIDRPPDPGDGDHRARLGALDRLAPEVRDAAGLCVLAGLSISEAADVLDAGARTLRRRVARARAALGEVAAQTPEVSQLTPTERAALRARVHAEPDDPAPEPRPTGMRRPRVAVAVGLVVLALALGSTWPSRQPNRPSPGTDVVAPEMGALAAARDARQAADRAIADESGVPRSGDLTLDRHLARCASTVASSGRASAYPPPSTWAVGPSQVGASGITTGVSGAFVCSTTPTTVFVSGTVGTRAGEVRAVRAGPTQLGLLNPAGAEVTVAPTRPGSGSRATTSSARVQVVPLFEARTAPFDLTLTVRGPAGVSFDAPLPDPQPTAVELVDRPVPPQDRSSVDGALLGRCLASPFAAFTPDHDAWSPVARMDLDDGTVVLAVRAYGQAGVCAERGTRQVFSGFPVDDPPPARSLRTVTGVGAVGGDDRAYTVLAVDPTAVLLEVSDAERPARCVVAAGVGVCASTTRPSQGGIATAHDAAGAVVAGPTRLA